MEADESVEPAAVDPARRRLALVGTAGFVVGALVLGVLWLVSGSASGPAADAKSACAALERIGELPKGGQGGRLSGNALAPGTLDRLAAAKSLSSAASNLEPAYGPLAESIDGVHRMVMSLNFAEPSGQRHVVRAKEICTRT